MILTKYFLLNKIKALLENASIRPHCYRSLDNIKYVLLLCEAKDWTSIRPCIETLKSLGKLINVCVYIRKEDETPIWDYAYLLVEADKDVNMWSFPDKNITKQMNGIKVDMLLDLTSGETSVMSYLMLQHPASFKVGAKRSSEDNYYDLSIIMKEGMHDISILFGQIMNYLQTIRSK